MTDAGWTREKPTKEGFYWHILTDLPPHVRVPGVLEIRKLDEGLRVYEPFGPNDVWHPLSEYGGLWLGPISPTDRQQGRVEGLREAADFVDTQELIDPSGHSSREQLKIYDVLVKASDGIRKLAQQASK